MTARSWVFTINNPCQDEISLCQNLWKNNLKFLIAYPEQEATVHYQGYLELRQPRRLSFLKKILPRAHLEKRRGSRRDAILYCLKTMGTEKDILSGRLNPTTNMPPDLEQTLLDCSTCLLPEPILYGYEGGLKDLKSSLESRSKDGFKMNLLQMKNLIESGADEKALADADFDLWVKYYRAFSRYRTLTTVPRNHAVEVIVLLGPTGTGKSKYCLDKYPNAYWKQRSNWWDGYESHDAVVFDEFYGWLPFDLLLRLCDCYPLLVETKGGQVQFIAKILLFTSNTRPDLWYKNCYFPAFARRVTRWVIMPNLGTEMNFTEWELANLHV